MSGDAVGAEVRRGTGEKDVFDLLARKGSRVEQDRFHELHLCFHQVWPRNLRNVEVWQKTPLTLDLGEAGKVLLVEGWALQVRHVSPRALSCARIQHVRKLWPLGILKFLGSNASFSFILAASNILWTPLWLPGTSPLSVPGFPLGPSHFPLS